MADEPQSERYLKGIKKLEELTSGNGYNPAESMLETINAVAPDIGRISMEFVLGEMLSRPGLDTKTREMLNVAVLTAIQAPIELRLHINIALNAGCTREEIGEIILQQVVYVGFPIAINGMHAAAEVFKERDARNINP